MVPETHIEDARNFDETKRLREHPELPLSVPPRNGRGSLSLQTHIVTFSLAVLGRPIAFSYTASVWSAMVSQS